MRYNARICDDFHFRFMGLFVSDKVNAREKRESIKAIYRSNNSFSSKAAVF